MPPFEALYGRPCRSLLCQAKIGDKQLLGPEMVWETNEKIKVVREKMQTAQTRYKSYAYKHYRGLEFEVGDHVILKSSRCYSFQPEEGEAITVIYWTF